MNWSISHRSSALCRPLADRHYTRQSVGANGFVPPGRCLVLYAPNAYWVTSWPFAEYVKHAWPGAWICSAFRNEAPRPRRFQSSELIREAVAATRWKFGEPPAGLGMVSFVDEEETRRGRSKRGPIGACFIHAGFTLLAERTKAGLYVLQMLPSVMPPAKQPLGATGDLFGATS